LTKRQFSALFLCSLVVWTLGSGLLPLLPVYAAQMGAEPLVAGAYLSCSYLALATGTVVAGYLSDRLQRRKALLIAAGLASIPAIWLMGRAPTVWHLTVLTATTWAGGVIGFAGTGYAIERLGMKSTLLMGASLPLIAIALLIPIQESARQKRAISQPEDAT
jgi:predicted MFS family arabinose efflux permease